MRLREPSFTSLSAKTHSLSIPSHKMLRCASQVVQETGHDMTGLSLVVSSQSEQVSTVVSVPKLDDSLGF